MVWSPIFLAGTRRSDGFTYVGLLIFVATFAIGSVMTLQAGALFERRAAESELLAIGGEFRAAILSYSRATPVGQARYPRSLNDLLRDPRYPGTLRHLRKVYADPITGKTEWGTIDAPGEAGFFGIHSLSKERPIKLANFDPEFAEFEGRTAYQEWVFGIPPAAERPGKP